MIRKSAIAVLLFSIFNVAMATVIPVSNLNVIAGLSPYNWVSKDGFISSSVNGASLTVKFKGTTQVAMQVDSDHMTFESPNRFPIIAWSVNGGEVHTHQLAANEKPILLSSDEAHASYGYLLARHFRYRESRLAYGGYDWGSGMANIPMLDILIDSATSTMATEICDKIHDYLYHNR